MARPSASQFSMTRVLNDKYLLGDEIGKGAYGRVYKGVDLLNGDFVAIKQVSLENISPDDLATIMQEIDLLKVLNHRNIVKYLGSFKTATDLYILLEFVENGSLANVVKPTKFGALPESLAAVYVAQVLEGLVYLHEQGVIHRDIKGANILTTKQGVVKLADFGVASKVSEADGNELSVVGTPYWMAPEVIEMSGVTAAADIWSVGCTVVELLTCVPPYYDLQPMPALFRIVQDDAPPIPPVSAPLADFLQQCFQKDSKARPTAATLLTHPWLARLAGTQRPTEVEAEEVAILPQPLQLPPPPPQPPSPPPSAHSFALQRFCDSAQDRDVTHLFCLPGLPPPALRRREAVPFSETEVAEVAMVAVAEEEGEGAVGRRALEVESSMADLHLARPEEALQHTCDQLLQLLPEEVEVRAQVVARQSALPLTDLLSVESPRVLSSLLRVVAHMLEGCPSFHHRCGASGMFPPLLTLATAERSRADVRVSAAKALRAVCVGSPLGLSMLLACRSLPVLVGLVEADYRGQGEVLRAGLDCMEELATRPELALELARSGLLLRLLNLMHNLTLEANGEEREGEGERTGALLLALVRGGEAVKAHFCSPVVLKRLLELVDRLPLPLPLLLPLLRCCNQLSMDPACLDPLQRANAIPVLVVQLEATSAAVQFQALSALYNLTRMSKRRQEMAAEAGLVPRLMALLGHSSPLNQFALPLLCDLAHASRTTRSLLRQHGALNCFLALLRNDLWAVSALDSLAACLAHDDEVRRVEQVLLRRDALERLVAFFGACSGQALVAVLDPFLRMLTTSVRLNAALGVAGLTPLLVARLDHPDAVARLLLLKMIKAVYERHPRPKQLLLEHDLPRKLQSLSEDRRDGSQELVKQMACTLLKGLVGKS